MRSACSARRVSKPSPPAATSGTESSTASRTTNSKSAGGPRGSPRHGAARPGAALPTRSVFPSGTPPAARRSGETPRRGPRLPGWRPRRAEIGGPGPGGTGETWSRGARPEQGAASRLRAPPRSDPPRPGTRQRRRRGTAPAAGRPVTARPVTARPGSPRLWALGAGRRGPLPAASPVPPPPAAPEPLREARGGGPPVAPGR